MTAFFAPAFSHAPSAIVNFAQDLHRADNLTVTGSEEPENDTERTGTGREKTRHQAKAAPVDRLGGMPVEALVEFKGAAKGRVEDKQRDTDEHARNRLREPARLHLAEDGVKAQADSTGCKASSHPPGKRAFVSHERPVFGPVGALFSQLLTGALVVRDAIGHARHMHRSLGQSTADDPVASPPSDPVHIR